MSNEITLEQIEQWAKAGVPVKDFSKDGSALVLVSPPYAKNFEDAWNMFFRILRLKNIVVPINCRKDPYLLLIHNGALVAVFNTSNLILHGKLACGLHTLPDVSKNVLADILKNCGESIIYGHPNG